MHSKWNKVTFTCYFVKRETITASLTNPLWNVCTCMRFKMWLMWGNVLVNSNITLTFKSIVVHSSTYSSKVVFESIVHPRIRSHFENIYDHKYRKHHGCDTAILSLRERLKQELDNLKVIDFVSMDLSKSLWHSTPRSDSNEIKVISGWRQNYWPFKGLSFLIEGKR